MQKGGEGSGEGRGVRYPTKETFMLNGVVSNFCSTAYFASCGLDSVGSDKLD